MIKQQRLIPDLDKLRLVAVSWHAVHRILCHLTQVAVKPTNRLIKYSFIFIYIYFLYLAKWFPICSTLPIGSKFIDWRIVASLSRRNRKAILLDFLWFLYRIMPKRPRSRRWRCSALRFQFLLQSKLFFVLYETVRIIWVSKL